MWFWSHVPAPLQPAVVQALPSLSGHGVLSVANVCVCTHTPRSGLVGLTSQPAIVHTLPSVSVHGVLVFGVHWPLVASQPPLHSSAAGHVLVTCFWSHTPAPLQPAVVHALPSLSGPGVLSCCGVHVPVVWSQPRLHPSTVQLGQIGRSAVCPVPDCRVALQVASPWPLM